MKETPTPAPGAETPAAPIFTPGEVYATLEGDRRVHAAQLLMRLEQCYVPDTPLVAVVLMMNIATNTMEIIGVGTVLEAANHIVVQAAQCIVEAAENATGETH